MGRPPDHDDRGAAAIELAIILPILLVMIFGIIDFGRIINTQMALTEASREAARAYAFGQTPANSLSRAQLITGDSTTAIDSSVPCPAAGATAANTASVTLRQTYTYITPIMALLGTAGSTRTLKSTGVMACVG
ncbi:TadE family protein [Cryptosporangium japonicum]|uniref:Pilus assembly protein n=1 Tax=Cryptosporangium japonicum TaxID=80872 RepID=A0ABN0TVG3_9ACTN